MEKNPIEQQAEKMRIAKEENIKSLARVFDDNKEKRKATVEYMIEAIGNMHTNGLVFNKDEVLQEIRDGMSIGNKEEFIDYFMKVLDPVFSQKFAQPVLFEKAARETIMSKDDNIKLSEILFAHIEEDHTISIHVAESIELVKTNGIKTLRQGLENGLHALAQIVKQKEDIKEIRGTSWIIGKNPSLMENLGFTLTGNLTEAEKVDDFPEDKRDIGKAMMTREDFLARYGK